MKSMVEDMIGYFNRRTKAKDLSKEAPTERRSLAIQNGEAASRLMKNQDFALLFNLYRFGLLESLEESKDDMERISNAHRVAGVRDFITYVEQVEYHGKIAVQRSGTQSNKE